MFKNIECDHCHGYGTGIVSGEDWVASPFVMNFGYSHRYNSMVYECVLEDGKYIAVNKFENEPVKALPIESLNQDIEEWTEEISSRYYKKNVLFYARPKNYKFSFWLGSDIPAIARFDADYYNYIHILFYRTSKGIGKVRIAAAFISDFKQEHTSDSNMDLLYETNYESGFSFPSLITLCSDHFKHTLNLYRGECFIRFLEHPRNFHQYRSKFMRFDSGRSPDTGLYDRFSVVKTICLNETLADSVMAIMPGLRFEED